jgi:hypothetical protein
MMKISRRRMAEPVVRLCCRLGLTGLFLLFLSPARAQLTDLTVRAVSPGLNGWFRLAAEGTPGEETDPYLVFDIKGSPDFSHWIELAAVHGTNALYTDPASKSVSQRFYRVSAEPHNAQDWKNQIKMPDDPFRSPVQFISWIKFAIATNEPTRVYFADSARYELHYDFVTNRVPGFANLTRAEVDGLSLYNSNRQVYLGTVIQPWIATPPTGFVPALEYGIQFVGRDPIPREKVREMFDIVRAAILSTPATGVSYIPTFEQSAAAEANRAYFEANGILLRRADDWIRTETCYSLGWALGRLVFVTASGIPSAYAAGSLRPTDILLTDGIPAELPYVAGIITFAAATPNSHVAILAQSYNVPFVFISDPTMRERILSYTNREIALQLTAAPGQLNPCQTKLVPLDTNFDPALKSELLALKQPPALNIRRKERFGAYFSPTTGLVPQDARFFGGKAANFGLLRRMLPTNSPTPSLAISMDLWDDFMDQMLGTGRTLRAEISNRLSQFTFPADVAAVKANLDFVRSLIRNQTQFTANQQQVILSALSPFATNRNIRFRSSSNVEDSDYFSGAGLYDSFSGCSGDDLDADGAGPSVCDPTETGERGVFRAIRRVYASFYNDNAFLERLRLHIGENEVGMGMLVHYSAPDETEMANGVATVRKKTFADYWVAQLVSQAGAVSVTNPDGNAVPEEVQADRDSSGQPFLTLLKPSNLVPFGQHVMTWQSDYERLTQMLFAVADAYQASNANRQPVLDFEYKKIQPGILDVKQMREVPTLVSTQRIAPYLLQEHRVFASRQHTAGSHVTTTHRLKSRWTFETRSLQVNASNLLGGLFTSGSVQYVSGNRVVTNTLNSLSNFTYRLDESSGVPNAIHAWRQNSAVGPAACELRAYYDRPPVSAQSNPLIGLEDFNLSMAATYDHQVWDLFGISLRLTNESVLVMAMETNSQHEVLKTLDYVQSSGGQTNVIIGSRYYLGSNAAYNGDPPLFRFEETRIEGLTSQPIVLHGFFSQTWAGEHRQSFEFFVFEPHLEEGIAPAILQELEAKNIRVIYVDRRQGSSPRMFTFSSHDAGPLPE